MTELDPARVVAAHAAWTQAPRQAEVVETAEYQLIRLPDRFPDPLRLSWVRSNRSAVEVLDEVVTRATEYRLPELVVCVKPGSPDGLDAALVARGATLIDTADLLALPLPADNPPPTNPGLTVRWREDLQTARDAATVAIDVFGGAPPSEADLAAAVEADRAMLAAGTGGAVVAYLDDEPVGVGGLELVETVARLWGGGVREDGRGRGAYRAMLTARLDHAVKHGATMAITQARVTTSSPILRRLGFGGYGQERVYRLSLDRR